jgi:hypothetical protein
MEMRVEKRHVLIASQKLRIDHDEAMKKVLAVTE